MKEKLKLYLKTILRWIGITFLAFIGCLIYRFFFDIAPSVFVAISQEESSNVYLIRSHFELIAITSLFSFCLGLFCSGICEFFRLAAHWVLMSLVELYEFLSNKNRHH